MGGICGFFHFKELSEQEESRRCLKRMTGAIAHRGPAGEGYYFNRSIALGHLRLHTGYPHDKHPPLTSESGDLCLVVNGQIYNSGQLRRELQARGHCFRSRNSSEVIIHLYEEHQEKCLGQLRGMFAFALWDNQNRRLLLARDRLGLKPLYYTINDNILLFASEAKAILAHPAVTARLNLEALPHFLTFQYFPGPESAFKGVMRLQPAHYLHAGACGTITRRYWRLQFQPERKPRPLAEYISRADQLLRETVQLHLTGDTPRGCFLSAGVDSSTITALLTRFENVPVNTYTINCSGGKYNELPFARETARLLGTRHHEITVGAAEFWEELPHILWHQDEPVADPSAIALYFAVRLAASAVKVVLSGEGADEIFAGYEIYREPAALAPLQCLPPPFKKTLLSFYHRLPDNFRGHNYLRRGLTPLEKRYFGNACIYMEKEKERILNLKFFPNGWPPPWTVTAPFYRLSTNLDHITRMQHLDLLTWLPGDILAKADRMSMAHSLELRSPFLDHILVEFATALPPRYKIRHGLTKYLLRHTAARYLPPAVSRRPKLGFPVPIAAWIRSTFAPFLRELFNTEAARTYFNPQALEGLLAAHCRGDADHARKLWTNAIFLLWHQLYFEKGKMA